MEEVAAKFVDEGAIIGSDEQTHVGGKLGGGGGVGGEEGRRECERAFCDESEY